MDKNSVDNRSNVPNPNHEKSGPGRDAGYKGNTDKSTMDNKSNQGQKHQGASKAQKWNVTIEMPK